jgi:HlyD family secretion protein
MKILRANLWWLVAFILIAASIGGYFAYQRYQVEQARQAALAALRTEVIARGDLVSQVSATGSLLPEQQSNLFFLLPGTVAEVLVESGDTVRAGQVLARLDDADLHLALQQAEDALAVAQLNRQKLLNGPTEGDIAIAKANLRSANAAVSDLQKGVGQPQVSIAQLQYDAANQKYQQALNQWASAVQFAQDRPQFAPSSEAIDSLKAAADNAYSVAEIGRLQLEQTKNPADAGSLSVGYARINQAKAALEQLQAPLAETQIQQADLAVEQARLALNQATLRATRAELTAPFTGLIAAVNVKAGERAGSGVAAFVIVDAAQFHLDVAVDEVDVAQLALSQPATITVDALPGIAVAGRVERLAPTALIVGGVVNYTVRILLEATAAPLRAGMSTTAQITVAEMHAVLLVPNWAIRRDRRTGQAYVSLKVGDTLTEVPIVTGLRGESYTEVTSGVSAGDLAAVSTARESINLFGGG